MTKQEVELEVIEKEPDIHREIMEKMQSYAEQDIKYSDLYILVTPKEQDILKHQTATAPSGEEYFCDAKVITHWKNLPNTPMVIPKTAVRRILGESL